jgi:Recombination directionality factor-like
MLKGLALTPPIIGRISIGKVVEKNGMRLPEKDDEFTLTSQVQSREGWVNHPLDQTLRKTPSTKLRSIAVRLIFDDPDLNLRANYTLFDRQTGRQMCVGNGETCRRVTTEGMKTLPCPAPDACELAVGGSCRPFGRLNVRIGDEDELGSFIFRTTGFNSIRTLSTRLKYFHAVSGGLLSTLPLELRLRGKSTSQSHRAPIYYVDLTVRAGLTISEAIAAAVAQRDERKALGFDQAALDQASKLGFAEGVFEESAEEAEEVLEEFFPVQGDDFPSQRKLRDISSKASLQDKLGERATSKIRQ